MTYSVNVGNVTIGGTAPVSIQSMCNIPLEQIDDLIKQAVLLEKSGCEIVRVSVPTAESALNIPKLKKAISIPVVADIHFDYKAAISSIENGADKIRINPGNMVEDAIAEVVKLCKKKNIPIRVGINSGSLEKKILAKYGGVTPEAFCESAANCVNILRGYDFSDIVVSMKASTVKITCDSYRLFRQRFPEIPLHVGVTEAGTLKRGLIKSSIGIGSLLLDGIGETIRVSLTADPVEEISAAKIILQSCGLKDTGLDLVSCPTCGRTTVDTFKVADYIEKKYSEINKKIKIAVMGCVVNGPGEANDADIGVTGVNGKYVIFEKGIISEKDINEDQILKVLDNKIHFIIDGK